MRIIVPRVIEKLLKDPKAFLAHKDCHSDNLIRMFYKIKIRKQYENPKQTSD